MLVKVQGSGRGTPDLHYSRHRHRHRHRQRRWTPYRRRRRRSDTKSSVRHVWRFSCTDALRWKYAKCHGNARDVSAAAGNVCVWVIGLWRIREEYDCCCTGCSDEWNGLWEWDIRHDDTWRTDEYDTCAGGCADWEFIRSAAATATDCVWLRRNNDNDDNSNSGRCADRGGDCDCAGREYRCCATSGE